jgi:hypothetical protein
VTSGVLTPRLVALLPTCAQPSPACLPFAPQASSFSKCCALYLNGRWFRRKQRCARATNKLILSWPLTAYSFVLETGGTVSSRAAWNPVTTGIVTSGTSFVLTNNFGLATDFYRLHRQ